jgi:hypothetical protein
VRLSNQFQTRTAEIFKPDQFCNAVDKNGEGIIDPKAHLTCYKVRRTRSTVRPQVITTDQFGQLGLNVLKRRTRLCVPSEEVGQPSAQNLDHFEMYRTKRTAGTPKFRRQHVDLKDQFLDDNVQLKRPLRLGVPTDRDFGGIKDPSAHLTCYSLRGTSFEDREVEVLNQFGRFRLSLKRPTMLCVPSTKQVVSSD